MATAAWFLGGTATLNVNDALTQAQASTKHAFDANQDGVFDANDSVTPKRLFCLTSPNSFSCGNLVPACFQRPHNVTLVGMSSNGGACIEGCISTADGSGLGLSGSNRLSSVTNGFYYDIDRGIPVDVPITQIDHFYDREALAEFLNGVYR